LAGYPFKGERSTGDKMTRALPLAASVEAGLVKLVRGRWVEAFLDELEIFPLGDHDDQVDATSLAFARLVAKRRFNLFCWRRTLHDRCSLRRTTAHQAGRGERRPRLRLFLKVKKSVWPGFPFAAEVAPPQSESIASPLLRIRPHGRNQTTFRGNF